MKGLLSWLPSWGIAVLCLVATGCASTHPTAAYDEVGQMLADRQGVVDVLDGDPQRSAEQVQQRVRQLLADPLTVEGALEIAMLNNRGLLATLENLGVAQADLVEAGLLDNPTIGGDLVSSTAGNGLGGGLALSQSLLSAFLIPAKRRLAKARLQLAVVRVTDATLALVRDVKVAHTEVLAANASQDIHRTLTQAAEVADDLAQRQYDAGNLTQMERALLGTALDEAKLDLAQHQLETLEATERLNRLLGLWGDQLHWTLAGSLRPPAPQEAALHDLERVGVGQRLDISAARFEVESIERAVELRRRGVVPQIEVGIEARNEVGNDAGHEWVLGPSLSVELPIFNPGHADFARLRAQLRQAQHRLQQLAIAARSHIRVHRARLLTARQRVDYMRDVVLPRHEVISARALEHYNGMLIGAYDLFDLRTQQVMAQQLHVEALRDYWIERAQLERAVGGRLPAGA